MSSILEIFFPLCASAPIRWQRRTADVECGIWPDVFCGCVHQLLGTGWLCLCVACELLCFWYFFLSGVSRRRLRPFLSSLLFAYFHWCVFGLRFAFLCVVPGLGALAVFPEPVLRLLWRWLDSTFFSYVSVAAGWVFFCCGFMAGDFRCVFWCIDGWRLCRAGCWLALVLFVVWFCWLFFAVWFPVVGVALSVFSAWAGVGACRLTVPALRFFCRCGFVAGTVFGGSLSPGFG
ncbi:hypothetical protein SK79_01228 [Escherichia coli]|nr:hypothetical protein SK79_01228 [Escherichia coli]